MEDDDPSQSEPRPASAETQAEDAGVVGGAGRAGAAGDAPQADERRDTGRAGHAGEAGASAPSDDGGDAADVGTAAQAEDGGDAAAVGTAAEAEDGGDGGDAEDAGTAEDAAPAEDGSDAGDGAGGAGGGSVRDRSAPADRPASPGPVGIEEAAAGEPSAGAAAPGWRLALRRAGRPWWPRRPTPAEATARAAPDSQRGAGPRPQARSRWRYRLKVTAFALGGAVIALALMGRVAAKVGPFDTRVAARPSWSGETVVRLSPLGTIRLDTHDWPVRLDLRVEELGLDEAERIAENPETVDRLGDDLADEVRSALVRLTLRCALVAMGGGAIGALLARLHWRSLAVGAVSGAVVVAGAGAGTAATFDARAVAEPRYTGLLTVAPTAVGDVEAIVERFGEYRAALSDLVGNIVTLYLATEGLPTFQPADGMIRVLHVSDVHLNPQAFDVMEQVTDQFAIDAVVDTGDITDWGTGSEGAIVDAIGDLDVPYVWVRGNHDSRRIQEAVAAQPNAVVLDGDATEVAGLRVWGIGDPRYTPNKENLDETGSEREEVEEFAPEVAEQVADAEPPDIDLVLVHDPRAAAELGGSVPLVLAGHTHEADEHRLEPPSDEDGDGGEEADAADGDEDGGDDGDGGSAAGMTGTTAEAGDAADGDAEATGDGAEAEDAEETVLLVEGSTGGAGLRGLQGEEPQPLTCTVLYFDPETRRLIAYDRITVQGLGETGATIDRHVLAAGDPAEDGGSDAAGRTG